MASRRTGICKNSLKSDHKPTDWTLFAGKNVEDTLQHLQLEELTGIKTGYGSRLRAYGISTALEFYRAPEKLLRIAFASKIGYDWWRMLHGWETELFDRNTVKTIGHSYALKIAYNTTDTRLHQILCQLVEKWAGDSGKGNFLRRESIFGAILRPHLLESRGKIQPPIIYRP